ncbi:Serine/threonine protein kinase [Parasponia andersonii]|uniref:Serine/threonine protein kinase n=1 Tax=Parasponia andersonii TaxID=3476 RepID=A0A2P5DVK2_PARAD|nr:Serine/threonine protein kinase [Parasponia andersonii]
MVSTRRSGSLSGNSSKRSPPSDDKPSSPKRHKVSPAEKSISVENGGGGSEKSMPAAVAAENSKEVSTPTPPPVDPGECGSGDAPIAGDGVSSGKTEAASQAVAVATPIAEGSSPLLDKTRSGPSYGFYQKQSSSFDTSMPWCKLLSQSGQNQNIVITLPSFTIGSNITCNFHLKEQSISGVLCKIRRTQRESNAVAVLESTGSKGSVQVNGTTVKKNASRVLNSGDEVVFGFLGNHAYVSFPDH